MRTREKLRELRKTLEALSQDARPSLHLYGSPERAARAALVMLRALEHESRGVPCEITWWAQDTLKEAASAWEGK